MKQSDEAFVGGIMVGIVLTAH